VDDINAELEGLKRIYLSELPNKIAAIQTAIEDATAKLHASSPPDWKLIEHLVHKLAGSSGTYGLKNLAELCRTLEDKLFENVLQKLTPADAAKYLTKWQSTFTQQAEIATGAKS
jgi:HPt (histidine-containing phosphotransfer) domain-containing protein